MYDQTRSKRIMLRVTPDEHFELTNEAAALGVATSVYVRQITQARNKPRDSSGGNGLLKPDSDFALTLATVLSMNLLTGAIATQGLEDELQQGIQDILKSLGVSQ